MRDNPINDFNLSLENLVEEKVSQILENKGIGSYYDAITPEEAAGLIGCSKQAIFDLINDRERSRFPGAKVSPKTYVVDRVGLTKWLRNGGLVGVQPEIEDVNPKLTAVK